MTPPIPHPTQPSMHLDEDDDGKGSKAHLPRAPRYCPGERMTYKPPTREAAKKRTASETSRERSAKTTAKEIARRTVKRTTDKAANKLPAIRRTKRSK